MIGPVKDGQIERVLRTAAAEFILPRFGHLAARQVHEKSPGDPVTVADEEAEVFIRNQIESLDPSAVVLGEELIAEHPQMRQLIASSEHVWLVDPLDGTANFVEGRGEFGLMVCELTRGDPTRSWILQPVSGDLYYAEKGAGAYLNGTRLHFPPPAQRPTVGAWAPFLPLDLPGGQVVPMFGSCAFDYPALATGSRSFLVHNGAKPWDHLPGALLLAEVGGRMGHCDRSPYAPVLATKAVIVAAGQASAWNEFADTVWRFQQRSGIRVESD